MKWSVDQILEATGGRLICGGTEHLFDSVGIDSRTIRTNQCYVPLCGERYDGHTFIKPVIKAGVRAVLIQTDRVADQDMAMLESQAAVCIAVEDTLRALGALAAFQRRQYNIPVVAVTGSNGKTSTRQMTASIFDRRFNTLTPYGNFNNEVGVPLTLFNLGGEHQAAVLELGMNHSGEIGRLGAICQPSIGMILNVAPAHLEFLGSLENIAKAKGELVQHIDEQGTLILNKDDPYVASLASQALGKVIYFGMEKKADVRAERIRNNSQGIDFELFLPIGAVMVRLQIPGRFMVPNALAAAAAGYACGFSLEQIKAGLESFTAVKGRLNVTTYGNGVHMIDDTYNANPASMRAAFDTLAGLKGNDEAVIVLADMLELGEQSAELHRQIGRRAAAIGISRLYVYGDFSEDVADGALYSGLPAERIVTGSKEDITADLTQRLKAGLWILVKGSRGMAMETVVQAIKHQSENNTAIETINNKQ
ncbi:MAG: UDP-N-acetylmuramoyl-tripeptide--D-alanyl-D-alanine ligase [Desulfobacteraceae bacterium]|nr:UDP-N-acetylmuramoyl-tripeptide--D-alanyl-D-alanine ligase [Desulfobacteraceae bacterium]